MYYLVGTLPSPIALATTDPCDRSHFRHSPAFARNVGPSDHRCRMPTLELRQPGAGRHKNHAFILCGYRRATNHSPGGSSSFGTTTKPVHISSYDVLNDVDPITGKVYGPGGRCTFLCPKTLARSRSCRAKGRQFLLNASNQIASAAADPLPFTPLQDLINAKQLALRTYAIRSNDFKANLQGDIRDDPNRISPGTPTTTYME